MLFITVVDGINPFGYHAVNIALHAAVRWAAHTRTSLPSSCLTQPASHPPTRTPVPPAVQCHGPGRSGPLRSWPVHGRAQPCRRPLRRTPGARRGCHEHRGARGAAVGPLLLFSALCVRQVRCYRPHERSLFSAFFNSRLFVSLPRGIKGPEAVPMTPLAYSAVFVFLSVLCKEQGRPRRER